MKKLNESKFIWIFHGHRSSENYKVNKINEFNNRRYLAKNTELHHVCFQFSISDTCLIVTALLVLHFGCLGELQGGATLRSDYITQVFMGLCCKSSYVFNDQAKLAG